MALTPSTMQELGSSLPDFGLEQAGSGSIVTPADFKDRKALLVMFICNHCPYVQHIIPELTKLDGDYRDSGLGIVAINSNSVDTHPQDGMENMATLAAQQGWSFPFLFDATQEVAKKFRAACTPDFFVYNSDRQLAYRGQLDDSRPGNGKPLDGADLRKAIDAIIEGGEYSGEQKPSIGCNIKWTPGNEPDYF